ncbi:MAG: metal ABC transporter ATP-binding protein [Thermoplasmata archaeon]
MSKALQIKDVTVKYGKTTVLKDVNLELEKGDFLGIIGPNGGGKTTLLKTILGLISPDEGSVRLYGKPPKSAKHMLGYIPQHTRFDMKFPIRVFDVVLMGRLGDLGLNPFYSHEDKKIARDVLKDVDMWEYRKRHISKLSGGQLQRVLLARALATKPDFLLLDEPTASVDEKIKGSLYSLLTDLKERGITIILVSHDIGVISAHVEKVACLNKYLIYHGNGELSSEMIEAAYECPIDLIAHGLPHRVYEHHMPEEG